jgi:hypothetical protein
VAVGRPLTDLLTQSGLRIRQFEQKGPRLSRPGVYWANSGCKPKVLRWHPDQSVLPRDDMQKKIFTKIADQYAGEDLEVFGLGLQFLDTSPSNDKAPCVRKEGGPGDFIDFLTRESMPSVVDQTIRHSIDHHDVRTLRLFFAFKKLLSKFKAFSAHCAIPRKSFIWLPFTGGVSAFAVILPCFHGEPPSS